MPLSEARALARSIALGVLGSRAALSLRLKYLNLTRPLTILSLHRVDDDRSSAYQAMSPKAFSELVGWLKKHFAIVTFSELADLKATGKPPMILSFDDGYRDFIEVVVPILHSHGVRSNQNIIPAVVESGRPPMNVELQDFIGQAPAVLLKEIAIPGFVSGLNFDDRIGLGLRASRALKSLCINDQKRVFAELTRSMARLNNFRPTPMMGLDAVRQVADAHEIGAHSFEHASMGVENDAYVIDDAKRCRTWFVERIGKPARIYAFPNGSRRPGQEEVIRQVGYDHVLLVEEAFSRPGAWTHPRFTMFGKEQAELRFRALGATARPAPTPISSPQ